MNDLNFLHKNSRTAEQREIEIKLALENIANLRRDLCSRGFRIVAPRFHELNLVFDTPGRDLARQGRLLRLRHAGDHSVLTAKSPVTTDRDHAGYKVRSEIEVRVSDFSLTRSILENSGFGVVFSYEKYREILENAGIHVMLDETPVGNFMEIEGDPPAIDRLAAELGFRKNNYITANYRSLFHAGGGTGDMLFPDSPHESGRD
ncbi:MAG TPA: class IV adenylate cyclase [Candidatus Aminicenantes bacterium]|nr:class IV adenylate cyclase [Candidatus Aminicenantes bacterium]